MIQAISYSANKISFKSNLKNSQIGAFQWDNLFNYLMSNTQKFYFLGYKLDFRPNDFDSNLTLLPSNGYDQKHEMNVIMFKINDAQIQLNRALLSSVFSNYEFPALLFSKHNLPTTDIINHYPAEMDVNMISRVFLRDGYLLYRSIEENVLWLLKGSDTERFPDI